MSPSLREMREGRGWSQEELADMLGVARSTIAAWERPERGSGFMPSRRSILALAQVFGVDPSVLTFGGDPHRDAGYPKGMPRKKREPTP